MIIYEIIIVLLKSCTSTNKIINFMSKMYEITGDKVWKNLEEGCFKYLEKNCIQGYNFEGQFEDTCFSNNYAKGLHDYLYPASLSTFLVYELVFRS